MSYQWDVFLSYRREAPVREWVWRILAPALRQWLPQYATPAPRLFLDIENGIPLGSAWSQALEGALRTSRCLVPVFNPPYFESEWCLAEFQTMLERRRVSGFDAIIPVQFADGNLFPPAARALQWAKFEPFNWYRRPSQTSRAFVDEVKGLCQVIVARSQAAPGWDPGWPVLTPSAPPPSPVPLPKVGT